MTLDARIRSLLAGIDQAAAAMSGATQLRVHDLAPWMTSASLELWLKLGHQQQAGEPIDAREAATLMMAFRHARRFRACGVSAGSRFPREELRHLRWLRWADRNGVPIVTPEGTAIARPVRAAPWMYRERWHAWARRTGVTFAPSARGELEPIALPPADFDIMTTA